MAQVLKTPFIQIKYNDVVCQAKIFYNERKGAVKMQNDLKQIRFNITKKMNETMIEMLFTQQMIEEKMYDTDTQKYLLIKHLKELSEDLSKEFKKNNKEQVKKYNEIMNVLEEE